MLTVSLLCLSGCTKSVNKGAEEYKNGKCVVFYPPENENIKEYAMFFQDVLQVLDRQNHPIVFLLWGSSARKLKAFLHNPTHLILECIHPSPLAANHGGWFGNNHFRLANEFLKKNGLSPIDWLKQK